MKPYFIACILLLGFSAGSLRAQDFNIPSIIPPSPTAQAFMRYGEIPVDYSTGVPNISIPLYTLKGKQLELPLSISYHASGIKVDDIATEVGLGWVLNAGGMVSRSVFGQTQDENSLQEKTYNDANALNDAIYAAYSQQIDEAMSCAEDIRNLEYWFNSSNYDYEDWQSDRFFYTLPNGVSGIFRSDYLDIDNIITLPYRPLNIEKFYSTVNYNKLIDSIRITDIDGVKYLYQRYQNTLLREINEWYISKIESADGSDVIKFVYSIVENATNQTIPSWVLIEKTYTGISPNIFHESILPDPSISTLPHFKRPILERIISSTSVVELNYATDREDFSELKRLVSITVSPIISASDIVRNIQFTHMYFGFTPENKRLGLECLTISSPGNDQPQVYSFKYKSGGLPSYPFKMTNIRYNVDYWGYSNGTSSITPIERDFIYNESQQNSYGSTREATLGTGANACMLNKITYPTGGTTVFEFERLFATNVYPYKQYTSQRDGYVGGYRVKRITTLDENNVTVGVKTYEYRCPRYKSVKENLFSSSQQFYGVGNDASDPIIKTIFSEPRLPLEVAPGLAVMYRTVIEYHGTKTQNSGKTVYTYEEPYSPYPNENWDNDLYPHNAMYEDVRYYHPFHFDRGNYLPQLESKTEYSFNGVNYQPISRTINTYTRLFKKEFETGIMITRPIRFGGPEFFCWTMSTLYFKDGNGNWWQRLWHPDSNGNLVPTNTPLVNLGWLMEIFRQSIIAIDTKAYQEASLLTNSKTYTFDPADSTKYVLTSTVYEYKESNLAIKKTTTQASNNDILVSELKYPSDFPGDNVLTSMVNDKHILTPVIEQIDKVNSVPVKSVKTNYSFWDHILVATPNVSGVLELDHAITSDIKSATFTVSDVTTLKLSMFLQLCDGHFQVSVSGPTQFNKGYYSSGGDCNYDDYQSNSFSDVVTLEPGNYTITSEYINADNFPDAGFYGRLTYSASGGHAESGILTTSTTPSDYIYPSSIMVNGENRLSFYNYDDNGNIVSFSKPGDRKESYLWGYNNTYPIARIENASQNEVAFTSFEDGFPVNWGFYSGDIADCFGTNTGKKAISGGSIQSPTLPAGTYIVSFWARGNTAYSNSNITVAGHSFNPDDNTGNRYSITVNLSLAGRIPFYFPYINLDDIRIHPPDAMMTTYTYDPLVGITSVTDPNLQTLYYEYDSFGRLVRILDNEKNILEQYKYNYAVTNP